MKRVIAVLLAALILCTAAVVPACAEAQDNETTIVIARKDGKTELTPSQTESCFWEYPTLTAGQHRSDGVLWLDNRTGKNTTVTITDFHLPTDNAAAMEYLKALHLTVTADGKTMYDGAYDQAGSLSVAVDVPKGEKKSVQFELGCDFTYTGESTLGGDVIYGAYTVEYRGLDLFSSWIFYTVAGVLLVVVIAIVITVKKNKKSA